MATYGKMYGSCGKMCALKQHMATSMGFVAPLQQKHVCPDPVWKPVRMRDASWLRTNGVNTNGTTAEVTNFDRLRKKYALALLGRQK